MRRKIKRSSRSIGEIVQGMMDFGRINRCLLCGGPPDLMGAFEPRVPRAWGAPEGKARFIFYGLCGRCIAEHPDRVLLANRIEKILWHEHLSGNLKAQKENPAGRPGQAVASPLRKEGSNER